MSIWPTAHKLRVQVDDFVVEEVIDGQLLAGAEDARFVVYLLTKEGFDTFVALDMVARTTGVPRKEIGYCGLKDRHSLSKQYLSFPAKYGTGLAYKEHKLAIDFIGYAQQPLTTGKHTGNRFIITVRKLTPEQVTYLGTIIDGQTELSLPNYFDSQRFGSLADQQEFIAVKILQHDYESALMIVLTSTYRKMQSRKKHIRQALKEHWGDWSKCLALVNGTPYKNHRKIFSHLFRHPNDYLGALRLAPRRELEIAVNAFSSFLWNELVKEKMVGLFQPPELQSVAYKAGELLFPRLSSEDLPHTTRTVRSLTPSALWLPHSKLEPDSEEYQFYHQLLQKWGAWVGLAQFRKFKSIGIKLRKQQRYAVFSTKTLDLVDTGPDTVYGERYRYATLRFVLPPGSYATVVIKALLG